MTQGLSNTDIKLKPIDGMKQSDAVAQFAPKMPVWVLRKMGRNRHGNAENIIRMEGEVVRVLYAKILVKYQEVDGSVNIKRFYPRYLEKR